MRFAVVDLEATYNDMLGSRHIIQIGISFVENDKVVDTLTIDVKPPVKIGRSITALTGITNEQVKDAPMFDEIAEYLLSLLEDAVFVAHNVNFDLYLLQEEFSRVKLTYSPRSVFDTVELAQIVLPFEISYGLAQLSDKFNIPLTHHHQAGYDAQATAHLLLKMMQIIEQLPPAIVATIAKILRLKGDDHHLLFQCEANEQTLEAFLEETYQLPQKNLLNLQNNANEAMHFSNNVSLHYGAVSSLPEQPKTLLVQETLTSDNVEELLSSAHFIDTNGLLYCLTTISQLTIQEVRQLAKVCVGLSTSHFFAKIPIISNKLRQRLFKLDPTSNRYQQYVQSMMKHSRLKMTTETFFEHVDALPLAEMTIINDDLLHFCESLKQHFVWDISISQMISKCFGLKNDFFTQQGADYNIKQLDYAAQEFYWVINKIRKDYPIVFEKHHQLSQGEQSQIVVSTYNDFNKFILIRLKNAVMQIVKLFDHLPCREETFYFKKQLENIERLIVWQEPSAICRLTLQKNDYTTLYTLTVQSMQSLYLMKKLAQKVKSVVFVEKIGFSDQEFDYINHHLVSIHHQPKQNDIELKNIYYLDLISEIARLKENLLVKKLLKIEKSIQVNTVIVLPSLKVQEKLKEQSSTALFLDDVYAKKVWAQLGDTSSVIYMTWHQLLQTTIPEHVSSIYLLKLPFDAPGNIKEQAYHYLMDEQPYFYAVQLPHMILCIKHVLKKISEQTQFYICDDRLIKSSYAKKIQTLIGPKYDIVVEKVETILNKW